MAKSKAVFFSLPNTDEASKNSRRESTRELPLPSISIIISHVNSSKTIRTCLEHLLLQDYPRELIEIIIVDGGSTDGSVGIVKGIRPDIIRQIVAPKTSEPEGQMMGIANSTGEIIMFTNSDIYVPSNWIRKHIEWLGNGFDVVGGKVF